MSASATPEPANESHLAPAAWGRAVADGIRAAKCQWVVYVPDNPLAHVLRALADEHPDIRTVVATREEEAFGIAAGLYLGGCRSAVMLQSSGLGNSLNAFGSLLIPYQIPVLVVISMRGGPGEWNQAQTPLGHAVPRILDSLGIQHTSAVTLDDAERAIRLAASLAFDTRMPAACLLLQSLTAGIKATRRTPDAAATDAPPTREGAAVHTIPPAMPHGARTACEMSRSTPPASSPPASAMTRSWRHSGIPPTTSSPPRDRPENFYTWGSMGLASSIGLGLALARPERRTIVLDGDGSLLMNLGSLATIGVYRPANLVLIVWDNGEYGTTGGQTGRNGFRG